MFDTCTRADLRALLFAAQADIERAGERQTAYLMAAHRVESPEDAAQLLQAGRVGLAAVSERYELIKAVALEISRRNLAEGFSE
jgi:hypothetical protein